MDTLTMIGQVLLGFIGIVANPIFYVALLLVFMQYWRQNSLERELFGVRVTSAFTQTGLSLLFGIFGGIVTSVLMALLGVALNPHDFLYVWALAVVLATLHVRWICFAYSGGILSLVSLVLQLIPDFQTPWVWLNTMLYDVEHVAIIPLLALIAILHLVEALLVYVQGGTSPAPAFVQSKRGRIVGSFLLQKTWVIPIAAFVVTGSSSDTLAHPSWWPLLPILGAGLQVIPIPAVLGFSGMAISSTPHEKAQRVAAGMTIYSLILLLLAVGAVMWPWLVWVGAIFSPVAHEWLIYQQQQEESEKQPRYVRPLLGLRILAVLPGSPAAAMELKSGEVIVKANGVPVNTPFDLHFAINQNPAFVKLEVLDEQAQVRYPAKSLYDGDHHGLGLILVPDDQARQFLQLKEIPVWKSIQRRLSFGKGRRRQVDDSRGESI